ncbi:hypothetical protein [Clostridium sp. JS66]|uniref:hypothetical protein n=1 Tax=Clostridium sp. JS66 TaxID=3064705 RepID=UPI00298E6205|nr:hypothetical protein [Clostridium sp. JS66]WPC42921.1 hypothetical protein Q6H37_05470 [Clostridium sp. JS66]
MQQAKTDLIPVTLEEMVDILNKVADSDQGSITVETRGMINLGQNIYSKDRGSEWEASINIYIKDEILYKEFIIIDYAMQEDLISFDALEIIGDIIYDSELKQFRICFEMNLEVVINVYDYYFEQL